VAFFDAEGFQYVGEFGDFDEELIVSKSEDLAGFCLPDEGGLVLAPGGYVAVEAVERDIDEAAREPLGEGEIPIEDGVPGAEPVKVGSDASPEGVGVGEGFIVKIIVLIEGFDVGVQREMLRGREQSIFFEDRINV
jgi:hypothetical protein